MRQLESLANELLLEFFEFLHTSHILRAFSGLNSRFNHLLYTHFHVHSLNSQSIAKQDFDILCQEHLQFLSDEIVSLRLSNEETPHLTQSILLQGFALNQFKHLQSLSLHYIHSLDTLNKIIIQCRHLPHLTRLEIINCEQGMKLIRIFKLFENIWKLPNLKYCDLTGIQKEATVPPQISSISSSIKYLLIRNIRCDLEFLSDLFEYTPCLQDLCTTIKSHATSKYLYRAMPSITSLRLFLQGPADSMKNIFEKMPNLQRVIIETSALFLDGNEWEHIINHYLTQIKLFGFKMSFTFPHDTNKEQEVDRILNTFRSAFWTAQHRWFVRCHWTPSDSGDAVILYTLPYSWNSIHYPNKSCSKSTCPVYEEYRSYDRLQYLNLIEIKSTSSKSFDFSASHFPNIRHLGIDFPFDDNFLVRFPSLDQLVSLETRLSTRSDYEQLQALLHQTSRLYSLKLTSSKNTHNGLFNLTSRSIQRLDLRSFLSDAADYLTDENSNKLASSPIGLQCEVLLIRIRDRSIALDLIKKMGSLRLLICACQIDGKCARNALSMDGNDELVQWLKSHLSPKSVIIRDPTSPSYIQTWIHRHERNFE